MIQEVFLETVWDEAAEARAARDQRAAQLQAEGYHCTCQTLYRITDGRCVFLVTAQPSESLEPDERLFSQQRQAARRPKPRGREARNIEYR